MTISGHKTRGIFDRYNIVSEADLRAAMQLTQTYLLNANHEPNHAAVVSMPSIHQTSEKADSLRTVGMK